MAIVVVSDTSPITNLAAIGRLNLLRQLYGKIYIPEAVYRELLSAGQTDPGALLVQSEDWIECRTVQDVSLVRSLLTDLDPGEAEAITLAVELKAERLIIDERRGRQAAAQRGLQVIGLLGLLIAAKQKGYLPQVQPVLNDLIANGFWIRPALYAEILRLAGE